MKRMKKQMVELCTDISKWWNDINKCKIINWQERSKNRTAWGPLSRQRSALDCSAIEQEDKEL
jgi:hypothetical protein